MAQARNRKKVDPKILDFINRYIKKVSELGVDIKEAYLFGSQAKGTASKYSDIDILIVSPDTPWNNKMDYTVSGKDSWGKLSDAYSEMPDELPLEYVGMSPEEFARGDSHLVQEIKTTGIKLV